MIKKLLIVLSVIALIALTGCEGLFTSETINIAGNSELSFDPDEAEVWAGISVVKLTADDAQAEANKVISSIVDGLRYKGISEGDISTERLSLREEKRYEDGKYKVVGWRATQTLKIKTKDLDKVGTIVDVCVENGANTIDNINFGLSEEKEREFKQQALSKATEDARTKAEIMASGLGVKLGKVKTVSESSYNYRPYMYAMEQSFGEKAVAEAAVVMPGDVTVTGHVNVVYYIK